MVASRRKSGIPRLEKKVCEICGFDKPAALNLHHIIPRCDPRSTNNNSNLAVVCHVCHDLIHASPAEITIIGVYSSTAGRQLMFYHGSEPPKDFLAKEYWKIKPEDNPLLARSKK